MRILLKAFVLLILLSLLMMSIFMPLKVEGRRVSGLYPGTPVYTEFGWTCACPAYPCCCGCYRMGGREGEPNF